MEKTKKIFKQNITELLNAQGTDEVLSEAALPAYAHKNPVIDHIFWKRLKLASDFISKNCKPGGKVLDFGCGTGVFSYDLASKGFELTSLDLDLKPVELLKTKIQFPASINFIQGDFFHLEFEPNSFDAIVALDVLEHIPLNELPAYLDKFNKLLKQDGYIVISGPTENILYKIGRKLAGNDFTGHYHETTIARIKEVFVSKFKVVTLGKLIWPFTLFEVFYASKK
ncbi:methyltransferase domain-containing protein [Flavobacterium sp. SM15]|uniref:class I SAM-dependent methyltransferase n=1 Tax=Flavobacterium sp. SM15 TaxID=2908005 RepID=UPI001EDA24AE|nr:class I SAM-dependent methyltransferase [Flavobacterium sp. SM15]MCG2611242.1 methyltransferase domain-containing protein [Flavobacterium sp. SM15]